MCSCLCAPDVHERGQQQELWRFVQKHQVVAAQAVVMHPEAVDLERRRIMMLVSVEERGTLQRVPGGGKYRHYSYFLTLQHKSSQAAQV